MTFLEIYYVITYFPQFPILSYCYYPMIQNNRNSKSLVSKERKCLLEEFHSFHGREALSVRYEGRRSQAGRQCASHKQTKFYYNQNQDFERKGLAKVVGRIKTQQSHFSSNGEFGGVSDNVDREIRNIRVRRRLPIVLSETRNQDIGLPKRELERVPKYFKYSVGGHKAKANQDRVVCCEDVMIVCDGHGSEGGSISSFVSQKLLNYSLQLIRQGRVDQQQITKIFDSTNTDLERQTNVNIETSGSTALLVLFANKTLYCANSGDCRAVMGKKRSAIELNVQHKPDRVKERERIFRMGGEIRKNPNGPYRIYNPDRKVGPGSGGLAVSRGFGDAALKKWGLIHEPDITKYKLDSQIDFLILGSDGFFEFFPVDQVISCTYDLMKKETQNIAQQLVQEATKRWKGYSQTDDISCIAILF